MADACDPVPSKPVGNVSGRKVFCKKLQKELPGLDEPPWPGELGQKVYENISAQAWKLWEDRIDRKSTRLNSSHITPSRMPSSA